MRLLSLIAVAAAMAIATPYALANVGCQAPKDDAKEEHSHCGAGHAHGAVYKATGSVKSVDKAAGKVVIAHDPVAALQWPAMTMRFGVSDAKLLDELAAGKKIDFRFVQRGTEWIVTALY